MKDYKEMTKCVLAARDEYKRKKQKQQAALRNCAPAVSGLCFAALIGLGVWKYMNKVPGLSEPASTEELPPENTTAEIQAAEESTEAAVTTEGAGEIPVASATEAEISGVRPESGDTPAEESTGNTGSFGSEPCTEQVTDTVAEQTSAADGELSGGDDDNNYLHWEEMTADQQYNMAVFGDPLSFYMTAEREVPAGETDGFICTAYMSGYDIYNDKYYHCTADVYRIKDHPVQEMVAIRFEGSDIYYLYVNAANEPPDSMSR